MAFQPLIFGGFTTGVSSGGGSSSIGGTITGGTDTSVLFIHPSNTLSQDPTNFNYNSTTHALTITGIFASSNFTGSSSGTNTGDITLGTANGLSLIGQVLSLGLSSTSTTGALSSSDWNTFNNKQPAFTSQTANLFFASPNGSSGVPSFRSIVAADLPSLSGTYVPQTEVGSANGVASLDSSGKIPAGQLPSIVMEYKGAWNPTTNTPMLSDGTGTNGNVYYVTALFAGPVAGLTDPSMVNFQIGDLIIYSSSIGKWQLVTPAAGVSSVNTAQGAVTVNSINQLTGDVTAGPASQSQSKVATIAQIQGNPVGGTTGTGNVVFSISPTITGTLNASSGIFGSTLSASNLSGTNTGDQTITLTGDITGSGTGTFSTTLATVNGNVGNFGSSTSIPSFTVNAKGLITAASINVVIAPAGTLTGTTLASNVLISSLTSLGIQASALNMGSNKINFVTDPTSAQDAATKNYVDNIAAGLNPAVAVQAATTSPSDTSGFTYNNGVNGIGAFFTGSTNTAVVIDNFTFTTLGQRLLVKNDTQSPSGAFNGIYYVTQLQTALLPPILTRTLDYDQPSDINNTGAIPVINGTINNTTQWVETALINTIGTDPLTFIKFARNPSDYLLASNGDISEISFIASDNQSSATNITSFVFANATVRSFDATVSIVRNTTYASYKLYGIQKASSWEMSQAFTGDTTGIIFSITNAGQIQYTSTSTGFTSNIHFRAITTTV